MKWDETHEVRESAVSGFLGNLHDSEEGSRHRERGLMAGKLREPMQRVNRLFPRIECVVMRAVLTASRWTRQP